MMGVSSIMMAFNKPDLRRRSLCAPIPARNSNLQLAAGHTIFALGCWSVLVLCSFVLRQEPAVIRASVAVLLEHTGIHHRKRQHRIPRRQLSKECRRTSRAVNVIANGMSFICGVFVPQSILSKKVLDVGRFLPAYWYVKANDAISGLSRATAGALLPIYGDVLIQLAFAAAIFAVTLLLTKERQAE